MQSKKQNRRPPGMRLTKRQAYPIIEQYFKSGLMPRDFYNQVGWSDNQFFSWRKRYMEEHNMLSEEEFGTASFHPITINSSEDNTSVKAEQKAAAEEEEFTLEIVYPNGVTLRVYSKNTAQLVDLIKLY